VFAVPRCRSFLFRLSITQPLTILLLRLSSRLRVIALNHPIDSVSMTVGLMSCTLSSFLLPKAPPKANLMLESLHYSIIPPLNPHTSSDLGRTAALEPTDDFLLRGHPIPDPSPPSANLRAVHRHLRNGDAIKARCAATGAPVGSVADPRTRALLAVKYVADPVEWISPSDESILRDKMAPIDRTALYVEDTTIL
jgi:hypothetical protein